MSSSWCRGILCLVVAALAAVAPAAASRVDNPAASGGNKTSLYLGAKRVGYLEGANPDWRVSDVRSGREKGIVGVYRGALFVEQTERHEAAGFARRDSGRIWSVKVYTSPGIKTIGTLRWRSGNSWAVYKDVQGKARFVGRATGPDPIAGAAALLLLFAA